MAGALLFFLFFQFAFAGTLPADHFLYPADQEVVFLAGLDAPVPLSLPAVQRILLRCDSGTAGPKYSAICEMASRIRQNSMPVQPFPWSELTAPVLFFGERHPDTDIKFFLTENMDQLRALGINALALEMFNSRQQGVLDAYLADQLTADELRAELGKVWGYSSIHDVYMTLIEAAKSHGMRLIALDDRDTDVQGGFFEEIHFRDRHMANVLSEAVLKDPSLRVMVLSGSFHAFRSFSSQGLVRSFPALFREITGLRTQSIITLGDRDPCTFNTLQKAIEGEGVSSLLKFPAEYEYEDFALFLRPNRFFTPSL